MLYDCFQPVHVRRWQAVYYGHRSSGWSINNTTYCTLWTRSWRTPPWLKTQRIHAHYYKFSIDDGRKKAVNLLVQNESREQHVMVIRRSVIHRRLIGRSSQLGDNLTGRGTFRRLCGLAFIHQIPYFIRQSPSVTPIIWWAGWSYVMLLDCNHNLIFVLGIVEWIMAEEYL